MISVTGVGGKGVARDGSTDIKHAPGSVVDEFPMDVQV